MILHPRSVPIESFSTRLLRLIGSTEPPPGCAHWEAYVTKISSVFGWMQKTYQRHGRPIPQQLLELPDLSRPVLVCAAADVDVKRALTAIPMVATSGDSQIQTYDGREISSLYKRGSGAADLGLLTPEERAWARKKMVFALCTVYLSDGYEKSKIAARPLAQPVEAFIVNYSAPQFEAWHLDVRDFMAQLDQPYVPAARFQKGGVLFLARSLVSVTADWAVVVDVLQASAFEDALLLLHGSQAVLEKVQKQGVLRIAKAGLGLWAQFPVDGKGETKNLAPLLEEIYLQAMEDALVRWQSQVCPRVVGAEFPFWKRAPKGPAGFRTTTDEKDLFILDPEVLKQGHKYLIVNAGDAFSPPGNEFGHQMGDRLVYTSLDTETGNNTDVRIMASPWFNRHLLQPSNWLQPPDVEPIRMAYEAEVRKNRREQILTEMSSSVSNE